MVRHCYTEQDAIVAGIGNVVVAGLWEFEDEVEKVNRKLRRNGK